MSVNAAVAKLQDWVADQIAMVVPFRATVTAVSGSKVQIQRIGEDTPGTAQYATTSRFPLAVGDVVLCLPLGSYPVIVDVIQFSASLAAPSLLIGPVFFSSGTTGTPAGSPDASTTSTGTYATAFSDTWLLPAGTWSAMGMGGAGFIHSASGSVNFYVEVNGGGALTATPNISSTVYSWWEDHSIPTGIVSDGSTPITVTLRYRSGTAGTTTPQAPKIILAAWRTA